MGSWFYLWENGDVSFVSASSEIDAVDILDEVGGAHIERLRPLPEGFMIGFKPTRKPPDDTNFGWKEDSLSEAVVSALMDVEEEARRRKTIPHKLLAPLNLLSNFAAKICDRKVVKGVNLEAELEKVLWKDEPKKHVKEALAIVESYFTKDLKHCWWKGEELAALLDDVVGTHRAAIFKEKKGQV